VVGNRKGVVGISYQAANNVSKVRFGFKKTTKGKKKSRGHGAQSHVKK
jgi:ribosomal protein S5